uniref:Putative Beta-lactamase domain protein n=1 Tax=Magnetococcus massalia (strain MO-1) TaxID=451514 RepID=A0A1S7LFS1_MAGMO|nr:putative Beta-lactamase domain protein [Candidatus Magnetococcus massalia]
MQRAQPAMELPFGITCIDADFHRPGLASTYLIQEGSHAAFVETGTRYSVPAMLDTLKRNRVLATEVEYVIVTHVHLDHAGGAGAIMQELPNAKLVVHPRGARHMIDPTKLVEGSKVVYGEAAFLRTYGEIDPIPASRVVEAVDGLTILLGDRALKCFDTQGHAKHHICIWDEKSRGIFTGDSFGISYRELDLNGQIYLFPSTTPVQFDPEQAHKTVDRLADLKPDRLFLTHFGMVSFHDRLREGMHRQLDAIVAFASNCSETEGEARTRALRASWHNMFLDELIAMGHDQAEADKLVRTWMSMDQEINTQGLEVWLDKLKEKSNLLS